MRAVLTVGRLTLFLGAAFLLAVAPVGRTEDPKKETAKPPTFKAPKGWESLEVRKNDFVMVTARFQIGKEEKAVAVVIVGSEGTGGGVVANVNRWREQVGLKSLDPKAVEGLVKPIEVGGSPGHLLDITGPATAAKPAQRIVAVIVENGGTTWFIKMSGVDAPVGDQKAAFDEFVKSIRFAK